MKRILAAVIAAGLGLASSAQAYIITIVPSTATIQNKANQVITLAVTAEAGDAQVTSFNMHGQIGDADGPGIEPKFVSFDYNSTTPVAGNSFIFGGLTPVTSGGAFGTQSSTSNSSAALFFQPQGTAVPANGNLVNITLDASNITTAGAFTLNLFNASAFDQANTPPNPPSHFPSTFGVPSGSTVQITSGTVTFNVTVPEPSSACLFGGITGLLALRRRRRTLPKSR